MSTTSNLNINDEYDIIIAGGGTAGCVVAGRLAEADPDLRILVLEAGPLTYNNPAHTLPARFRSHGAPGSRTVRVHTSNPSEALGGRSAVVRCGQCLGGGGSINGMTYTRACASDYDDWEKVYENPGWGSNELIPLLRKRRTKFPAPDQHTAPMAHLKYLSVQSLLTAQSSSCKSLALLILPVRGRHLTQTRTISRRSMCIPGGPSSCMDFLVWCADYSAPANRWIDAQTGTRSDVPHQMIYPLKETRPNLHIFTGIRVKHVTFDDENCATGVAFTLNPPFHLDSQTETFIVRGTKLVVVSAGTFGTPGILERTGIGAKDILEEVGVKQHVVDLPAVGENYQDHNILFVPYFSANEAQTFDAIIRNDEGAIKAAIAEFKKTGKSLIAHSTVDAGIKWRPELSEISEFGPEFKEVWDSYFASAPDKPMLWIGVASALVGDATLVPPRKYFTMEVLTEYPVARGHVHITDGKDVSAPIDFVPGYLESMADVNPLTWGYKFMREIARRMPHFRGEPPAFHPTFAPGSAAAIVEHTNGPVTFDAPRIEYSDEDERALEAYVRASVSTAWHALGTCAMKPRDRGGVVDSRLNVYGVKGLKVADLSICPANVAANTYSTALVIGEKAAMIIAEELGIKGVI